MDYFCIKSKLYIFVMAYRYGTAANRPTLNY